MDFLRGTQATVVGMAHSASPRVSERARKKLVLPTRVKASGMEPSAATLDFERDFDVASIFLVPVPLGPLVFVPTIDITGSVAGGASATFVVERAPRIEPRAHLPARSAAHPRSG